MLTIVGGTYFEHCLEPDTFELFGSGGRAASALAQLCQCQLITATAPADRNKLEILAATFGFSYKAFDISKTARFVYRHPLASPFIETAEPQIANIGSVSADNVLLFGMLEGTPLIDARCIVYDPQSGSPSYIEDTGTKFERLAYILNENELRQLTGLGNLDEAASKVMERGAEVVVVKRGTVGVSIFTEAYKREVPVFQTNNVQKIGTGDVFSAGFALCWAEEGQDPVDAATFASKLTALHADKIPMPFTRLAMEKFEYKPVTGNLNPRVYLAGPFFSFGQRHLIHESKVALEKLGATVFSPLHDVGLGHSQHVAKADLEGLNNCSVVFALLDGNDSGTLFEVGYARALEKPVVVFCENPNSKSLTMLQGSNCKIFSDFTSAIYNVFWQ